MGGLFGGHAHPLFHAAKRRNCDGDEDAIMLLMDGLLNFSRDILPANRGGQMDAPLVLTTRLNPTGSGQGSPERRLRVVLRSGLLRATQQQPHPKTVIEMMDIAERRLAPSRPCADTGSPMTAKRWTAGPRFRVQDVETMIDKMNGQLDLGHRLRAWTSVWWPAA